MHSATIFDICSASGAAEISEETSRDALQCSMSSETVNSTVIDWLIYADRSLRALTLLVGRQEGHPACKN